MPTISACAVRHLACSTRWHRPRCPHSVKRKRTAARSLGDDTDTPSSLEVSLDGSALRVNPTLPDSGRQAGDVVAEKYTITDRLGEGSSGVTYSALALDGTTVAIKELSLGKMKNWKQFELFEREARTLKSLNHPNIAQYIDYLEENGHYFLVQELAAGSTLHDVVQTGARMGDGDVEFIARDLLGVLQYLGSRRPPVIHRDIKPENVIIEGGQAGGRTLLVDFGGVQDAVQADAAMFGSTIVGTAGYMPAEQFGGAATPASDMYSLGAVLLFSLSGRTPSEFRSTRLQLQFEHVTMGPRLRQVLNGLLQPMAEDRWTVDEALAILDSEIVESRAQLQAKNEERTVTLPQQLSREAAFGYPTSTNPSLPIPQPWRLAPTKRPNGSKVELNRDDEALTIEIPPNGLSGDTMSSTAFAVAWNAFVAVWTVTAIASSGFIFAAFSLPFWFAGSDMVKNVALGALMKETFVVRDGSWSVVQELARLSGGVANFVGKDLKVGDGDVSTLRGARVIYTVLTYGETQTAIELMDGTNKYTFGESLSMQEQEWLVGQINSHLESLGARVDIENTTEATATVPLDSDGSGRFQNDSWGNFDD